MNFNLILNTLIPHIILFLSVYLSTIPIKITDTITIVMALDILIFLFYAQRNIKIINIVFALLVSIISDSMFDVPLGLHGIIFMIAYILISRNNQYTNIFVFNWMFILFIITIYTLFKYITSTNISYDAQSFVFSALFNVLIYPAIYFVLNFTSNGNDDDA